MALLAPPNVSCATSREVNPNVVIESCSSLDPSRFSLTWVSEIKEANHADLGTMNNADLGTMNNADLGTMQNRKEVLHESSITELKQLGRRNEM